LPFDQRAALEAATLLHEKNNRHSFILAVPVLNLATHGFGTVDRYAIITVTDSGHGMDAEHAEIILKPILPFVLLQKIREMLASPSPDV
jgi:hypothetical protein